jgi:hypothetical protein
MRQIVALWNISTGRLSALLDGAARKIRAASLILILEVRILSSASGQ